MAKKKVMDNLAKDAAAALAAGMSYGRWKAMQGEPVKVEPKKTELPDGWKVCPWCGKAYKPKRCSNSRQIYCELECQKAAQRERDRGKRNEYYRSYQEKKRAAQDGEQEKEVVE
jgi:hypothetical protein